MNEGKLTNFSHDTSDDKLLLASSLDGLAELGVVPGVDLTLTTDGGDIGVHISDLLEHEAVGALVRGGGQNHGEVEELSDGSMGEHVVAEVIHAVVTDDLRKTNLVVDDKDGLVLLAFTCSVVRYGIHTALFLSSLFHAETEVAAARRATAWKTLMKSMFSVFEIESDCSIDWTELAGIDFWSRTSPLFIPFVLRLS